MTDRQRQLIDAYLPNPPDPTLGDEEFYVLDTADRVRRVQVREILPTGLEGVSYGVYEVSTGNRIDAGWGTPWVGFHRGQLYDNRQDCRDRTHEYFGGWKRLREIQRQEAESNGDFHD